MSWSLKKWVFGSGDLTRYNKDFQQPQCVYFVEKYDELSNSVVFSKKLRHVTGLNGPKGETHENEF